ncbi:MAG: DUF520 family protein [Anaerolineae bacterium]|nr:DUF520 family protein [Anaerolineae bacterium]
MPSFDVVSEIDAHELTNAVDQANREIANRFDFKGTGARVERDEYVLTIIAQAEFQVKQVEEILRLKISKRGIDLQCLDAGAVTANVSEARQKIAVKHGLDQARAQGGQAIGTGIRSPRDPDRVRVTAKRDDLRP